MTVFTRLRTHASPILVGLPLLLSNATFGWSNERDPTTPGSQIAERLALDNQVLQPTADVATNNPPTHQFRLRAIVLRDNDNGTALVSLGNSDVYVVPLRRTNLQSSTNRLNIGGMRLTVNDFCPSCIIMQSLDTNQQFIINGRSMR